MVVIDDHHNGWRHLILPVAHMNDLVLNSVLAVSAFHLSESAAGYLPIHPRLLFMQAIGGLQNRRNLDKCDLQTKQFVILAIVVLLAAVMVNGCSDFPIVFRMLQSALDAVGGERSLSDGEVAEFLRREIHKMRAYGAPFIGQDAGRRALESQAQQSFDCLQFYFRLYPDHSHTFHAIASLRQQAYRIYLHRTATETHITIPVESIEDFKSSLETFSEGSLGEHTLVWAVFIAASESRVSTHRRFFEQFLERQYRRNRFLNLSKALQLLKRIWKRSSSENWTALLPEPRVLIM
ncbi:hypothetical protein NUU61_009839 [Penicillium alfredii]|uniref:Uncharacterized protein n=1 Tax=Penicillium alfredii TaxID=1506179 RepID=A0A9W9EH14_9EURO|nr:uncharacterized protein NUU61_009839 [Penicillium alfredii]KAJ5081575.1 hypothetical protein NUU61_009839 [Penicillium alfredii]